MGFQISNLHPYSEVMPISAFGILSATMIAVLFAVNVLLFPPALCLYAR